MSFLLSNSLTCPDKNGKKLKHLLSTLTGTCCIRGQLYDNLSHEPIFYPHNRWRQVYVLLLLSNKICSTFISPKLDYLMHHLNTGLLEYIFTFTYTGLEYWQFTLRFTEMDLCPYLSRLSINYKKEYQLTTEHILHFGIRL